MTAPAETDREHVSSLRSPGGTPVVRHELDAVYRRRGVRAWSIAVTGAVVVRSGQTRPRSAEQDDVAD